MNEVRAESRIDRRKVEFRNRIVQAALKLFKENGIAETSVASIIREADIAHKTFFNYFPTKDHLLQHIVLTYSTYAYEVFRNNFSQHKSPNKRIEFFFMSIANEVAVINPNYRDLINYYLISGAGSRGLREQQREAFFSVVRQILCDADEQGLLRRDIPLETLAEIIADICVSSLLNWSLDDTYPLVKKMKESVAFINSSVFVTAAPS